MAPSLHPARLDAVADPVALRELRALVADAPLDLPLPGVAEARAVRRDLLATLDDLLLPRLAGVAGDPGRPMPALAVVAGPTGAGKSTLVNSLVRAAVSVAGVLRPTTYSPVLVCHPDDAPVFESPRVLAELRRVSSPQPDPATLFVVRTAAVPRGLALLDAPDVDSVAHADRGLAERLLAAADLWLFVTTAERYADAVAWRHLSVARDRETALVVVLDRVPPRAVHELRGYVEELLAEHGFPTTPVFVVPEGRLEGGLLSEFDVVVLRDWLHHVAGDPAVRDAVVGRTVRGALASLPARVARLADAVAAQEAAAAAHRAAQQAVLDEALATLRAALASPPTGATGAVPPSPPEPGRRSRRSRWWQRGTPTAPAAPPPAWQGADLRVGAALDRVLRRVAAARGTAAPEAAPAGRETILAARWSSAEQLLEAVAQRALQELAEAGLAATPPNDVAGRLLGWNRAPNRSGAPGARGERA